MLSGAEETEILKVLSECESILLTRSYHIKAVSQAMMEVFCAFTSIDIYGRIKVILYTDSVSCKKNRCQRIKYSKSKVRVVKPRIGGDLAQNKRQ